MSGIEGGSPTGGAQQAAVSKEGKATTAERRAVPDEEISRFSKSLSKSDGKNQGDNGNQQPGSRHPAPGSGKTGVGNPTEPGLPTPQSAHLKSAAVDRSAADALATPLATEAVSDFRPTSAKAEVSAAPGQSVSDLAEKLAGRIMASRPESGASEVRIELNMNKLQGAVITLKQDANGLNVMFESPSPEVTARLAETRGDLVQRLQNVTGDNVNVEIREDEADQDNDSGEGGSSNRQEYEDLDADDE